MRGVLGSFIQFLGSVGVLLIFSAGCFLNWYQMAGIDSISVGEPENLAFLEGARTN